jgi:hypothetical protein
MRNLEIRHPIPRPLYIWHSIRDLFKIWHRGLNFFKKRDSPHILVFLLHLVLFSHVRRQKYPSHLFLLPWLKRSKKKKKKNIMATAPGPRFFWPAASVPGTGRRTLAGRAATVRCLRLSGKSSAKGKGKWQVQCSNCLGLGHRTTSPKCPLNGTKKRYYCCFILQFQILTSNLLSDLNFRLQFQILLSDLTFY